jgi:hypothetical protein
MRRRRWLVSVVWSLRLTQVKKEVAGGGDEWRCWDWWPRRRPETPPASSGEVEEYEEISIGGASSSPLFSLTSPVKIGSHLYIHICDITHQIHFFTYLQKWLLKFLRT